MSIYNHEQILEISTILSRVNDPDLINRFLESILTKKELTDLSSRWELVKLLEQGFSQRKIAEMLGLSLCKITRGSRELKQINSALKKFIDLNKPAEKNKGLDLHEKKDQSPDF